MDSDIKPSKRYAQILDLIAKEQPSLISLQENPSDGDNFLQMYTNSFYLMEELAMTLGNKAQTLANSFTFFGDDEDRLFERIQLLIQLIPVY